MKLLETAKEFSICILEKLGLAWWVEIVTEQPKCTYYFGPFASADSAELAFPGYIEDLKQEEAQEIVTVIKQCQPRELTIFEDKSAESLSVEESNLYAVNKPMLKALDKSD